MNLVVSDASPIRYLIAIEAIHVLPKLFEKVVIPQHVIAVELTSPKTPPAVRYWVSQLPDWVEILIPEKSVPLNLHTGEEQAIALALQLDAPILLDEKDARDVAQKKGLLVIGTIGLLEIAAAKNYINLKQSLDALQRTNMRLHPSLIESALKREAQKRKSDSPAPSGE